MLEVGAKEIGAEPQASGLGGNQRTREHRFAEEVGPVAETPQPALERGQLGAGGLEATAIGEKSRPLLGGAEESLVLCQRTSALFAADLVQPVPDRLLQKVEVGPRASSKRIRFLGSVGGEERERDGDGSDEGEQARSGARESHDATLVDP